MSQLQHPRKQRTAQQEATRAVLVCRAIVAHRKDMRQVRRALAEKGEQVSVNELLHFFYGTFRHSNECAAPRTLAPSPTTTHASAPAQTLAASPPSAGTISCARC